jgi:hypothetical protein
MKLLSNKLGPVTKLLSAFAFLSFSAFELLITINSRIWNDYPVYMIGVVTAFILSAMYLVFNFRRLAAN